MTAPAKGPAYRIHTNRMVLRCWEPADAPLLKAAIDTSIEHLRPWMPWAIHEPTDISAKIARLRLMRGNFDLGTEYVYGLFDRSEDIVLGGSGLHPRVGESAIEIGYWIHAHHINQGLATEVTGALTRVAFEVLELKRVEIHCDPQNVRSATVPAKLGFTHEATLRQRTVDSEGKPRDTMIWTLLAEEYSKSAARSVEIEAFDVVGKRIR